MTRSVVGLLSTSSVIPNYEIYLAAPLLLPAYLPTPQPAGHTVAGAAYSWRLADNVLSRDKLLQMIHSMYY